MTAVSALDRGPVRFALPETRSAVEPPEARGLARDQVRLLVAAPGALRHTRFDALTSHLRPGDLLVVNTSATLPAALDAVRVDQPGRDAAVVHVAGPHPSDAYTLIVELRQTDGHGPIRNAQAGEFVRLTGGATLELLSSYPDDRVGPGARLWQSRIAGAPAGIDRYLAAHGRPITYGYLADRWPLETYQSVFAREPGSAEMASAGRPFTPRLVADLVSHGIGIAPIILHAGVSSLEVGESPPPERYVVPAATARHVRMVRSSGGRVVAVGTTVTRALETAVDQAGSIRPASGWTDLVLGPEHPSRVVDGLITGWHAPDASHLHLLAAVAGHDLVQQAYDSALADDYLWHEFGDSCLLLP